MSSLSVASAGPPSVEGGKAMKKDSAHHMGGGWPSAKYDWWNKGKSLDWAIGGELVYGDWVGAYSDITFGVAINGTLKWNLLHKKKLDLALRFAPGLLMGSYDRGRFFDDRFVFGFRGEVGVPISIDVHERVNVIGGVVIPFSIFKVEDFDPHFVVPFLFRAGAEFEANKTFVPFLVFEFGPALIAGEFDTEVDFAFRVWTGVTIW